MDPTTLDDLVREGGVILNPDGLVVTINPSWIIDGENRVSYTTLIRLVECCREHHWSTDILSRLQGTQLDSITKTITGEFIRPIVSGSTLSITYQVTEVREKGYSLEFTVRNLPERISCARINLACVFYDAASNKAIAPPIHISQYLANSLSNGNL